SLCWRRGDPASGGCQPPDFPREIRGLTLASKSSYLARLASQSRLWGWPPRSVSIFPLRVSPLTLPVYLVVVFCPLRSRVTLKETSPSLYLASSIAVSWLFRPTMAPVNLSPSSFNLSVVSRVWPPCMTDHFQVPVGFGLSCACAAPTSPVNASTRAA